jgi:hypothetical protein
LSSKIDLDAAMSCSALFPQGFRGAQTRKDVGEVSLNVLKASQNQVILRPSEGLSKASIEGKQPQQRYETRKRVTFSSTI